MRESHKKSANRSVVDEVKYVDFKKFTDENGAKPIYLFEGEEAYFREKGEVLLKSRFFV